MAKKKTTKTANKVSTLDLAKKAIEKKYGDVIKPMSEKPLIIDTISTRSIGLDMNLGRGGVALGRIYEIYGGEASGKCVTADTYVNSSKGLISIEELFELNGTPTCITNKVIPAEVFLKNENGCSESTSHFTWNNRKTVRYIKTSSGLELKCTYNHKVRVIDETTGFIVWKKAGELNKGDYLLVSTSPSTFEYEDFLSEEEATFIGMLISEGYLGQKNSFSFTNEDTDMLKLFESLVSTLFGYTKVKHYTKDNNTYSYLVHSKEIKDKLSSYYDMPDGIAKDKIVPLKIRRSSNKIVSAFLRAYFSLDGSMEKRGIISASSASRELLKQIQLLLLDRFGIKARFFEKFNDKYNRYYYHLEMTAEDVQTFIDKIGFILKSKQQKAEAFVSSRVQFNAFSWAYPYQSYLIRSLYSNMENTTRLDAGIRDIFNKSLKLSKNKLTHLLEACKNKITSVSGNVLYDHFVNLSNYACTKVVDLVDLVDVPTFDVVMPETHSFVSNGLISHNTTLAMSIIAEAQSRGMSAAFIDAEHSADPQLFESMGVDLDKLTVIDLYTGEENLDAAEMLMKTGELDLLVVDSVTALIPKDQADKDIGDNTIALLARLMSTTLLRYVPIAAKNNVCIIFINQTRNKVGGYGNPETTTGGNALKFYATGRIKVSGAQAVANRIKDEEGTVVGHMTKFEIVKNKLSAPFKANEVPLYYGIGYDMEYEIINYAVDLGIIEKKGAWYYYKGDTIGQGEAGARNFFDQHPEIFTSIKDKVISMVGLKPFYEAQKEKDKQSSSDE